jgi:U3 small nucleolar RNA-associated protein 3
VRRKGHVREVRTEEGHKYGGEETGIKSGLSRSRKLGT